MSDLGELRVGGRARVERIVGNDEVSVRLMEMGVLPGVELKLLGCAPLGDPLELELRGYRLSVRRSEARRIEITPL
ncbi:MAG TPA: ferrous iron transport protein A [Pirellulales bacterium]|nr:ferrous iron transport protein A [Pirellulales bacterium]